MKNAHIDSNAVPRSLLIINVIMALVYISWWVSWDHIGNVYLYSLLFLGEMYHLLMAIGFYSTVFPHRKKRIHKDLAYQPSVDILIPVAGEPLEVVRQTALAARDQVYKNHSVYILNDSFVAEKLNWMEYEKLAHDLSIHCITRTKSGGAKAGNINNALRQTNSEFVAILDADMVPHSNFLQKLVPYLKDPTMGFVQSPQYYKNFKKNEITAGAWEQQNFFFGPIMKGKNSYNAAFICGTNVVIRRRALEEVGGMNEKNIAEDFLTSMFIHQKGWRSWYIDEVLCEGLAPEDLLSYIKQQQRWARGSLEVVFNFNPLFQRGLSLGQRIQYLLSGLYYLNGFIVLIDMMMPILFLLFGIQIVSATTTSFAFFFIPYIFLTLYTLYQVSNFAITFRAISFSQASFFLQLRAIGSLLLRRDMSFSITPKVAQSGNFLFLVYPHLFYIAVTIGAGTFAVIREGFSPSVVTNIAWALFNIVMFVPFINSSFSFQSKKSPSSTVPLSPITMSSHHE